MLKRVIDTIQAFVGPFVFALRHMFDPPSRPVPDDYTPFKAVGAAVKVVGLNPQDVLGISTAQKRLDVLVAKHVGVRAIEALTFHLSYRVPEKTSVFVERAT